ncbi:hypothetical protein HBI68_148750 [Parastagonospora nodorum]|nr:hypothetical protein HBI68_148750 [Parastagonospora nodorum]
MQRIDLDFSGDTDLSRFSETLDLLAVVPTNSTLPTFIGHCAPPEATARYVHMYTQLSAVQIEYLQDHKPHGTWTLPCPEADFSGFLSRQIVDLHTHSADPDMISKLSTSFAEQQAKDATQVQLFSIKVLRENNDGWLVPNTKLMWKWVKPQSAYRTSGAWESTLEKAVIDGEWSAGKELVILVKSVREDNS